MSDLAELNLVVRSQEVATATSRLNSLSNAAKAADQATGRLSSTSGGLQGTLASLATGYSRVHQILVSVAAAGATVATAVYAIKEASDFQATLLGFETLLGSAQKAKDLLEDLTQFSLTTPFELKGLLNVTRLMLALGFEASKLSSILRVVTDAAAAMGGSEEMLNRIVLALGQMQAKGKVSAQEMNQLAEAGIGAWRYLAQEIGESIPSAMRLAEKGAIDSTTAINAILAGMTKSYKGASERLATTTAGLFSNLRDTISVTLRDVGQALIDTFSINALILRATDETKRWGRVLVEVLNVVSGMPAKFDEARTGAERLVSAVYALSAAVGTVALSGVLRNLSALPALLGWVLRGVTALGGPITLVVTVGVSALVYFRKEITSLATSLGDFNLHIGKTTASIKQFSEAVYQELEARVVPALQILFELGKRFLVNFVQSAAELFNQIRSWVDQVSPVVTRSVSAFLSDLGTGFEVVGDTLASAFKAVYPAVKNVVNLAIASLKTLLDFVVLVSGRISETFAALAATNPLSTESISKLGNRLAEIGEKYSPEALAKSGMSNFSRDFVGEFAGGVEASVDRATEIVKQGVTKIRGAFTGAMAELASDSAFRDSVTKLFSMSWDVSSIVESIQSRASSIAARDRIIAAFQDMRQKLGAVQENAVRLGRQAWGALSERFSTNAPVQPSFVVNEQSVEKLNDMIKALELERSTAALSNDERERAVALAKFEEVALEAYGKRLDVVNAHLQIYAKLYDEVAQAKAKAKLNDINRDLDREILLSSGLAAERQRNELLIEANTVAMKAYGESSREAAEAVEQIGRKIDLIDRLRVIQKLAEDMGQAFGKAFEDVVLGASSATEAIRNLGKEILSLVFRQLVTNQISAAIAGPLQSGLSGLLGAGVGGTAPTPSAMGNVFDGGRVTAFAMGGVVDQPTLFPMAGGKRGLMGESGPEAVVPLRRGADGRLGIQSSGSRSVTVYMTVNTPDADGFRRSSSQIAADLKRKTRLL